MDAAEQLREFREHAFAESIEQQMAHAPLTPMYLPTPDVDGLAKLREPFDPKQIGKLPRGGTMLDFVGHAQVTNRLLEVDPAWSWEPCSWAEDGGPQVRVVEKEAMLWIRLTVCGVTRLGVGIVPLTAFELEKQLVSDAIRNAAMRFGVALDLWSKEDLHTAPPDRQPPKDGDEGEHAWNPRNAAEGAKLWQLQLRIRALPEDVGARLAERWKETESLAGKHVSRLTAGQYRVAKALVEAWEKVAREEDPKWKAPPAQREVLAALGSVLDGLAIGFALTPVPPEPSQTPQEADLGDGTPDGGE